MLIYTLAFIILWSTPACPSGYGPPESPSKSSSGDEIDHTQLLVNDISKLYQSDSYSDVILSVGGEKFHVHRILLASRSKYFSDLFYGGEKETYKKTLTIKDVPVNSFKIFLEYIYTGRVNLSDFEVVEVFELYRISDLFGLLDLQHSLHVYFQRIFKVDNVCPFYTMTRLYPFKELIDLTLDFIDNNALKVLESNGFLSLPPEVLQEIISRDSFYVNEFDIFRCVCSWIHSKKDYVDRGTKVNVLSAVRYSLMSNDEMSKARKSKLVGSDIISEAIQKRKTSSPEHPFRGKREHNVNLINESQKFILTNGNLIPWAERPDKDYDDEDLDGGYNMIRLGNPTIINYIEIKLWHGCTNEDQRNYSYYIKVSIDGYNWTRVIDHSNYNCRSLQRLWIQPRIVRYIHVVGTKSDANVTFKICNVQYNTNEMHKVEIKNGLIVPKIEYNVTSCNNYAIVIKGEDSVVYNTLLDVYNINFPMRNSYTYHHLGSGCIVVHLAQPYILSSMKLLLWGDSNQYYRYTIESSLNNQIWETVVDKSKEWTQSWQMLQFNPRPMLYIRITGVRSSAGNDFRCIYFEAPAQVTLDYNVIE